MNTSKGIIVLFVLGVLILAFLCSREPSRQNSAEPKQETTDEATNMLNDAADMLESKPITLSYPKPKKNHLGYEIAETKPSSIPYVTKVTIPKSQPTINEINSSNTQDSLYVTSRFLGDNPKNETTEKNNSPNESEWKSQYSDYKGKWTKNTNQTTKPETQKQEEDLSSFYSDIKSWATKSRTANEARVKAYNIRQEANKLREDAENLTGNEQEIIKQKATIMEDYSKQINATRGNSTKINLLRQNAEDNLQDN